MPHKSWESLDVKEEFVRRWARDLNPNTARNYVYYLLRYLRWCMDRGYWSSAEEMLKEYEVLGERERFRHLDILEEYVKSKGTGVKDRRDTWHAVRNFYDYYRLPLPKPPRSEASKIFRLSDVDKRRALETSTLKLEEVRALVLHAPQPYKAVFMVMFQGAMGIAEYAQFNTQVWKDVVKRIDESGPVCIDLYRSKTSRTEVKRYYTFLGEDAKNLLKEWLKMRPEEAGEQALFVGYNKNEHRWVPVNGVMASNMIRKVAQRTGLIKRNTVGRYHIHAHEFRDLFKSMCTLAGVQRVASEFFLGHDIDKLGYDKSPRYDIEWFRNEYLKIEPKLNILSNPVGETYEGLKKGAALEAVKAFARMLGIENLEVKVAKMKELAPDIDEAEAIGRVVKETLGIKKMKTKPDRSGASADPKKVIDEDHLESYLAKGWDVQTVLPSGRILIKK